MMLVIFKIETRADIDGVEYQKASERMHALAATIHGFISLKGCSSDDGENFAIARFASEESLEAWRNHPEHVEVQRRARAEFYESYSVQVCKSVREYEWRRGDD